MIGICCNSPWKLIYKLYQCGVTVAQWLTCRNARVSSNSILLCSFSNLLEGMNPFILTAIGLNITTTILQWHLINHQV